MSAPVRPVLTNPEAKADQALLRHFDVIDVKVEKDGTRLLQCQLRKRLVRDANSAVELHIRCGCRDAKKRSKGTSTRSSRGYSQRRNGEGLVTHISQRRYICRRCHEDVGYRTASLRAHVQTCLQGRARTVDGKAFIAGLHRVHFEISPGDGGGGGGGGEGPSVWRRATCRHCQIVMQERLNTMLQHLVIYCRATTPLARVQGRSDTPRGKSRR